MHEWNISREAESDVWLFLVVVAAATAVAAAAAGYLCVIGRASIVVKSEKKKVDARQNR